MPLEKVTLTNLISELADTPDMSAADLKAYFDSSPQELETAFNNLIDQLSSVVDGNSGADNIKATAIQGLTGETIQALLESLKKLTDDNKQFLLDQISDAISGGIPEGAILGSKISNGTITDEKLSNEEGQLKPTFTNHVSNQNIHVSEADRTTWNGKQDSLPLENRRKVTIGTDNPTGGVDGDIYFQYE